MNSMKCCSQRTRGALLVIEETSAVQALQCGPVWAPFLPSLCLGEQLHRGLECQVLPRLPLDVECLSCHRGRVCTVSSLVGGVVRLVPGDLMLKMLDTSKFSSPSLSAPFLTLPRIVFILGLLLYQASYWVASCAVTSQTTNEWYRGDRACCQHCSLWPGPHQQSPGLPEHSLLWALEQPWGDLSTCCCTLREKEEMRMGRVLLPLKYSIHLFRHMGTYFLKKKKKKNLVLSVLVRHCARP